MFSPIVPSAMDDDDDTLGAQSGPGRSHTTAGGGGRGTYVQMNELRTSNTGSNGDPESPQQPVAIHTGRGQAYEKSRGRGVPNDTDDPNGSGVERALIHSEHPSSSSVVGGGGSSSSSPHAAASRPSTDDSTSTSAFGAGGALSFEVLSLRLRNLMMEDASETAEEELEMTDYDNPEDAILERKFDEDGIGSGIGTGGSSGGSNGGSGMNHSSSGDFFLTRWICDLCSTCGFGMKDWRKLRLTFLRMIITILIGICIGLTGFAVSRSVGAMIHANLHILNDMMNHDRPAAAFFVILILACIYTGVAALFVTFGSWQTRGSGVGRLNAYLSGMSSSKFLALKTLFVKIGGLILCVSAGIKQGMEGPFIHIGAMVGLHVSRAILWTLNLFFSRWGVQKYTQIIAGVLDERMFISGGAAAGFSVAFNAPIAGVLYVQDGAFAYWQGEYTIRTFLCTMTAVTTINMCWKSGSVLPSRGLIDIGNFLPTTITLQEFWGFIVLGILGGLMGIAFTKCNVLLEKFRQKYLQKLRLPNVLDVLACTVLTVLLSFILPFLLSCHPKRYDDWCVRNPDRCVQFQCGPGKYNDLATFFFTLPEETIRILFDRTPSVEAQISYEVLIVFCLFYTILACLSYGMAVPGGLFIPSIIIGASYGRLVGLAVQQILPDPEGGSGTGSDGVYLGINPGVYAVLGSASMLGGITRMTLPISVMMIEVTSDAQFLIPIMMCVLLAKVVADFGCGSLYAEHLKLDGLIMVFGDRPPNALKKLLAKDVMSSKSTLRKLHVVSTVQDAWVAIKETRHNAFPVTDSSDATLRSILQKQKRNQQQFGVGQRRRSQHQHDPSSLSPTNGSSASLDQPISTPPTGVFLGLIQRRHLVYVLTSMPCFPTASLARDSEPMTALPYELALANASAAQGNNGVQRRRGESTGSSGSSPGDGLSGENRIPSPSSAGGGVNSSGALEVVSLHSDVTSPSLLSPPRSVSHAMMHGAGGGLAASGAMLNEEGASASASFVEWIARQSHGVGQDLNKVASGSGASSSSSSGDAGPRSSPPRVSSPPAVRDSPYASSSHHHHDRSASVSAALPALSASPGLEHSSSSGSISGGSVAGHGHVLPLALGQDLSVQRDMLGQYVNLSPFIDQGAYTVSENISAKRVWSMFRSLGMRHIVVLNHQHQPVGVITRRDLIRFAVAK